MIASELFDFPASIPFREYFPDDVPPWEWLDAIPKVLAAFDWLRAERHPGLHDGIAVQGRVYLHPSVKLPPRAVLQGPAWIGPGCEIRPNAFIRGNVIAGAKCVLGHCCEYKNALLLDRVETAHYNYVGDSILGNQSHLGAGVILANLRLDRGPIAVAIASRQIATGRKKLGALIGDGVEVGCNTVLQPGTILGRKAVVLPGAAFGGYLEPEMAAIPEANWKKIPRSRLEKAAQAES